MSAHSLAAVFPACFLAGSLYALVSSRADSPFLRQPGCWIGLPLTALLGWSARTSGVAWLIPLGAYLGGLLFCRELKRSSWLGVIFCMPLLALAALVFARGHPALLIGGLAYLLATCGWLWQQAGRAGRSPRALNPQHEQVAHCLGLALFPPLPSSRYHAGQTDLGGDFSRWLSIAPWYQRVGMGLGLEVLDLAPLLVTGRPRHFTGLSEAGRSELLTKMEHSKLLWLPLLLMLFKTALSLHYYERDEVLAELACEQGCLGRNRPEPR